MNAWQQELSSPTTQEILVVCYTLIPEFAVQTEEGHLCT
jgi:hypothetical protein